ncbi:MAG: methyltransferase domain-containing protein [Desulfobacterales bacterium]|jgi:ubiquinone/menaquinone biosynthesis C-methylase UbiE/NAD-dependent dihydropyrimidine dehydrogenase PreA subunit
MFSYIFMKILETRPSRYDKGISLLTAGHAKKVKEQIVASYVRPGIHMLDVGCGTGELLLHAARAGATVTGVDISKEMLSIARERFQSADIEGTFYHTGVTELDTLLGNSCFDVITSTLVFSELYTEERKWALSEFARLLKPTGVLVLADEVKPRSHIKNLLYHLVRFPLAVITYIVAQTATSAVSDIYAEVTRFGFEVIDEKRTLLDSFAVLSAKKSKQEIPPIAAQEQIITPDEDISITKSLWDFIGRWFPNPVEPGLRKIGQPGTEAPVFVTGNFHLTVRRVEKSLADMDAWLLVVPTLGINVWCASTGGDMTVHSVITGMKTSRIEERVSHRRMILPQLSASGVDRRILQNQTDWKADFGPVRAQDLQSFVDKKFHKTPDQCRVRYPLSFRLEMLFSMNALLWAIIAFFIVLLNPIWMLFASVLFWGAGFILYAGYPVIPGNSGWLKAGALSFLEVLTIGIYTVVLLQRPWWAHWGWMSAAALFTLWLGFDLKGTVGGNISEAESLLHKLGVKSIGTFFSAHPNKMGTIQHDPLICNNCLTCINVCPRGVYEILPADKNMAMEHPEKCFNCGACVLQCPSVALSIRV